MSLQYNGPEFSPERREPVVAEGLYKIPIHKALNEVRNEGRDDINSDVLEEVRARYFLSQARKHAKPSYGGRRRRTHKRMHHKRRKTHKRRK